MMIGVAQVIGTKPIFNSFFSNAPALSRASALAAPSGKMLESEASTAPAPRLCKSSRRVVPSGNTLLSTATSTRRSIDDSADSAGTGGDASDDPSFSFKRPPEAAGGGQRMEAPGARARPSGRCRHARVARGEIREIQQTCRILELILTSLSLAHCCLPLFLGWAAARKPVFTTLASIPAGGVCL